MTELLLAIMKEDLTLFLSFGDSMVDRDVTQSYMVSTTCEALGLVLGILPYCHHSPCPQTLKIDTVCCIRRRSA